MADPKKDPEGAGEPAKQPFVSQDDRPQVRINVDTPLSELRVRDLTAILGSLIGKNPFEVGKTPLKDFFDKPFPEETKDFVKEAKPEKFEKPEKSEKIEKNEKIEKPEKMEKIEKNEKHEKPEKRELKEVKAEKLEVDGVFDLGRSDPRVEQIIQAVAGLTRQVGALANQVEELRKKVSG